jgi:hypothetical protein
MITWLSVGHSGVLDCGDCDTIVAAEIVVQVVEDFGRDWSAGSDGDGCKSERGSRKLDEIAAWDGNGRDCDWSECKRHSI